MEREVAGRFKREGTYVYLWLVPVDVCQKPLRYYKVIILQLKINYFEEVLPQRNSCLYLIGPPEDQEPGVERSLEEWVLSPIRRVTSDELQKESGKEQAYLKPPSSPECFCPSSSSLPKPKVLNHCQQRWQKQSKREEATANRHLFLMNSFLPLWLVIESEGGECLEQINMEVMTDLLG